MATFSMTANSGMMPRPAPSADVMSENDMVRFWYGSQMENAGGVGVGRPASTDSAGRRAWLVESFGEVWRFSRRAAHLLAIQMVYAVKNTCILFRFFFNDLLCCDAHRKYLIK